MVKQHALQTLLLQPSALPAQHAQRMGRGRKYGFQLSARLTAFCRRDDVHARRSQQHAFTLITTAVHSLASVQLEHLRRGGHVAIHHAEPGHKLQHQQRDARLSARHTDRHPRPSHHYPALCQHECLPHRGWQRQRHRLRLRIQQGGTEHDPSPQHPRRLQSALHHSRQLASVQLLNPLALFFLP